jgi:hypothetical protein
MANYIQTDHGILQLNFSDIAGTQGASAFAGTQTNGFILQLVSGVPTWSSVSATNATNISSGAAGQIPYQSAAGTTGFTAAGTTGQVLVSGGTGSPTWTSSLAPIRTTPTVVTATVTGTYTVDFSTGTTFVLTLTGATTFTFANPPASGFDGTFNIHLVQDGTGSRTVTWPSSVQWSGANVPVLTTTASKKDIFTFITVNGGTSYSSAQVMANVTP